MNREPLLGYFTYFALSHELFRLLALSLFATSFSATSFSAYRNEPYRFSPLTLLT